ncbi:MAG: hypothetical protein ACLP7J_19375, partial [Streptosporangiaceae bacterium]
MASKCDPTAYEDDTADADTGPYKIGDNNAVPFAGVYDHCSSECQYNEPLKDMNPGWTAAGADVFITFDEGDGNGNQVYAVLTGPGVTGGANATGYSHYSLL